MKITKQRLKEIIREELTAEGSREDMMMPAISQADFDAAMATDDEQFTGGSPEERLLTLMKARELLAAMSKEELTQLSLSLDGETTRALQHLLANPMYAKTQSVTSTGPWSPEKRDRELEEYRSTGTGGQSAKDREKPARPSSDTRSSNTGYRSGATGKKNQGRGGY
tara:strand:- start:180 stop:680 length:501 start_codon:yes stop_codon:yes gene_type:complete